MTEYFVVFIVLFLVLLGYIKLANKLKIIDTPIRRSSHKQITVRGGGIVFLAVTVWAAFSGLISWTLFTGIFLAGFIGFMDDMKPLPVFVRLPFHFIAVAIVFWDFNVFDNHYIWVILAFLLFGGWVNAFNFMDGINGITVLYSLSALIGFYFVPELESQIHWIRLVMISLLVFGVFNLRKKALVFAGDVGSFSMAFVLGIFMLQLIYQTQQFYWLLFFGVYGIDAVATIFLRLRVRENIFRAHRSHLYQYLANEFKMPHLQVSFIYFIAQMLLNAVVLITYSTGFMDTNWLLVLFGVYCVVYLLIRNRVVAAVKKQSAAAVLKTVR